MAKPRKQTRTGKKLTAEGKVAVPTVTRDTSGKLRGTTEGEKKAARTTVLPVSGPKVEKKPEGRMSLGAKPIKKGFAVAFPVVEKAVNAATYHLGNMRGTHGTDEFHAHHEAFNAIHANIGQMSPELHTTLGQAKHEIMHPTDKTDGNLALIHKALSARLAIGRTVHTDNLKRATEGKPK
jgi:hypothetical protein